MAKNSEYEKMPKNLKDLDEHAINQLKKTKWVVTEKVHGANFSFVYEDNKLQFAKRREYLNWTDDFFGFQLVANTIEENILQLFEQLRLDIKADRYIVYGELFGGKYPHADVMPDDNVQAIQTGVYYCADIKFCAFDIAVETGEEKRYLDYKDAIAYFERFNIFYAKALFSGKLNEALNFNIRINSSIPLQLGLPDIGNNLIEGVVIKPLTHNELTELESRPVIKVKNPEFDEEEKFHEAKKWSFVPNVSSASQELSFLVEEMSLYITNNRLNSVLSKTGALDTANEERMKAIRKEFLEDIFTDFSITNDNILNDLNEQQKEWIGNRVSVYVAEFINSIA